MRINGKIQGMEILSLYVNENKAPYDAYNFNKEIRVSHPICEGGNPDTKKRLYIRRTADGTKLLAYCHNCGKSGVYVWDGMVPIRKDEGLISMQIDGRVTEDKDGWYTLPFNFYKNHTNSGFPCSGCHNDVILHFPEFPESYIDQYGVISMESTLRNGWSSLAIPASFDAEGQPQILSLKNKKVANMYDGDLPKWLHYWKRGVSVEHHMPPILDNPGRKYGCIVEDRISGIIVANAHPDFTGITLSGKHISEENLFKLICLFPAGLAVWLDQDATDVAREIVEKGKLMGGKMDWTNWMEAKDLYKQNTPRVSELLVFMDSNLRHIA